MKARTPAPNETDRDVKPGSRLTDAQGGEVSPSGSTPGFGGIIGQDDTIRRLRAFAELYRSRAKTIGHILLVGSHGSGRRTIAHAFGQQYGLKLTETAAGALEKAGDLAYIIADLENDDIFFLRDVDKLRQPLVDLLDLPLQNFELDIIVGKGAGARRMKLAVKPFTCIATVQKEADCPSGIRDSFSLVLRLQRYSEAELEGLATALARQKGFSVENAAAKLIVRLSEENPGRIEKIVRHLALIGKNAIALTDAEETLSVLGYKTLQSAQDGPSDLNQLSGADFERLIASLL
jgi:Holliday junction DNA helicase RuvB